MSSTYSRLTITDNRSPSGRRLSTGSYEMRYRRKEAFEAFHSTPGTTYLGGGCFSRVYAREDRPGVAFKLGQYGRLGDFGNQLKVMPDAPLPDGWLAYVKWTAENPSPFAPVVHRLELHDGYFIAEMEALRWHDPSKPDEVEVYRRTHRHPGSDHAGSPLGEYGARVERFAAEAGFDLDCHKQNLMFRADGTPVMTDPLC